MCSGLVRPYTVGQNNPTCLRHGLLERMAFLGQYIFSQPQYLVVVGSSRIISGQIFYFVRGNNRETPKIVYQEKINSTYYKMVGGLSAASFTHLAPKLLQCDHPWE